MDPYVNFNRKNIDDRQIDTLIGLSKGLLADGKLVQSEAEFLHAWLVQAKQSTNHPVITNLCDRVAAMLVDGILDEEESAELLALLHRFNGEDTELGELAKPTSLPLCSPAPSIVFEKKSFLFTGTCIYGSRRECQDAIANLGGKVDKGVTKKLDYLIIGSYVTESWAHESFGRKIEKAMEYRSQGLPLSIISEEYWAMSGKLI